MASGSKIIVTANPRGIFMEGFIASGRTPKPGTTMQISNVATVGGRHTWTEYAPGTDGDRRVIAVLLEDHLQGKLATDAYAAADRCFLYFPVPGEELNVLKMDVAGTADDFVIGDLLMVDSGTGKVLLSAGSIEAEPFVALEAITDPTADTLVHVMFTGY